jgi:O-antigen/teichoic acid export membrane protein
MLQNSFFLNYKNHEAVLQNIAIILSILLVVRCFYSNKYFSVLSLIRKLASDTALYGVSSILGRLLNYALVPLHTLVFVSGEMGVVNNFYAWVAILNVVYTYGMETSFFRYAKNEDFHKYYNLILSAVIVSSIGLSALVIGLATPITNALKYPGKELFVIWLAVILATDAIVAIPFARLRAEKKARQFATVRVVNIALNVFFNLFFLWFCRNIYDGNFLTFLQPAVRSFYQPDFGVGYIFLANLLANLMFFPMLWNLFRDFKFQLDWKTFKPVFNYGYPILIMGLGGTLNQVFDRISLRDLLPDNFYPNRTPEQALGIYGNVYKLSIFMNLAVQAFRYAAEPFFFAQAENKNSPRIFANVMKWFVIACCLIWLGVSANLNWLAPIFLRRPEYMEGIVVVPVLLLGNLFLGIYYNVSVWFKLTDKTYFGTYFTLFGAVVNVLLNIILVPKMGYMGCAWAFAFSCMLMTIFCYVLGEKHFPVPYPIKKILLHLIFCNILILAVLRVKIDNYILQLTYQFFACGLYAGFIFLTERKNLKRQSGSANQKQD